MSDFELVLGALANPIEKQLRKQRLKLVKPHNAQAIANAIALLGINGCLSPSEVGKARKRLMDRIHVVPIVEMPHE